MALGVSPLTMTTSARVRHRTIAQYRETFDSRRVVSLPFLVILTWLVNLKTKDKNHMKTIEAKVKQNFREDPKSEPDHARNTWLIAGKLNEHIADWENVRLDFRFPEIQTEILETGMSEANRFTVRTRGESPLQKGDVIHVYVRDQYSN
jgi:hypothetical protein